MLQYVVTLFNYYLSVQDSTYKYFEVILVDAAQMTIKNDHRINWICNPVHKHRELRGLTFFWKELSRSARKGSLAPQGTTFKDGNLEEEQHPFSSAIPLILLT